jgi:hypothetical protein
MAHCKAKFKTNRKPISMLHKTIINVKYATDQNSFTNVLHPKDINFYFHMHFLFLSKFFRGWSWNWTWNLWQNTPRLGDLAAALTYSWQKLLNTSQCRNGDDLEELAEI